MSYLKRHFHGNDWTHFDANVEHWWSRRYRMSDARIRRAMEMLARESRKHPVLAFTHGNFIDAATGVRLHNCEAVASYDSGKTWTRSIIGKSPSRTNPNRRKRC